MRVDIWSETERSNFKACSSFQLTAHRDLLHISKRYNHWRIDKTETQRQIWFWRKNIHQDAEEEREECDRRRWYRNKFCQRNFNYNVEDYLNVCNNTQADLFNKIKTLFLINYWTLSVKWLIIIRDFFKNSVKTLSRFWQDFNKPLLNKILINLCSRPWQGSNQS